ncbi:hypothetical protein NVP1084O_131 [Vibrio phage 1.084.O._10N.261.49.F5]|nr:hypothetical protein NVP1084O_131 [Vibrio phage 1.084.O._10N.261.49.F5]
MASQIFSNKILNGNALLQVGQVEIIADASGANDAVRKSQVESIAAASVQSGLVNSQGAASTTTTFTSDYVNTALATKQNNMSVDASSTSYLEIVDGTKIKLKDLGITSTFRDTNETSLASFIASATFNGDGTITVDGQVLDKMTFIFLTNATLPQDRTFVYLGTNNGDATDFVAFGTNYNASEIRSFFNSTGTGILFDANTGVFSLDFGTTASEIGGQTIPHGASFTTISPNSDIKDALVKLEALINAVDQSGADGTSALTTRLNNLSGVTGNNYGTFTGSSFADNQNGKQLFQASETLHESATSDRAAIRSEFAAADTTLQSNIDAEEAARISAVSTEAAARSSADSTLQTNINTVSTNLSTETSRATAAENALDVRLDVIEGVGVGSVSKAQTDAQDYADAAVLVEKNRAEAAESALDTKIDNLQEGDITYVGKIVAGQLLSIRADRVTAGDTRDGLNIKDVAIKAGEVFVVDVAQTVTFDDASTIVGQVGDKLMATETVAAGSVDKLDFNITQADGSAITIANIGSSTIELNGSDQLDIVADSIGRTQLDAAIEADVDDKVSLTADSQTITGKALKIEQSDSNLGSSYGLYVKKTQTGTGSLTGTSRGLLVENWVETDGSGNPALPSYAHNTIATHYDGDATDMSVVVSGAYCEANAKATSAINAIGSYSVSTDTQLGVNIGAFAIAENAATSNVSLLAYASTDGAGADRGVVGAITNLDIATYSGTRVADPFPHNEVAVVADAKYAPAGSKALYAYGDVIFEGGSVTVPSASADTDAVNLGDIKSKERIFEFDLVDGVAKTITVSGIDLDKAIVQTTDDNQSVDVSVVRDAANNEVTVTATGGNLTGVRLLVQELSCAVTTVA